MKAPTRLATRVSGALVLLCLAAFAPSAQAACPNEAVRKAQTSEALPTGTVDLPACMALEMVSPPVKRLQFAKDPTFSADGQRVRFRSAAGLAGTPGLQSLLDNYVATRTATGWVSAPTSAPTSAEIASGPEKGGPYAFSPDFGGWLLFGATQAQSQAGIGQLFRGGLDGSFSPLSPLLVPVNNSGAPKIVVDIVESESNGASSDLSATVFHPKLPSSTYLPNDPVPPSGEIGEPGGDRNNYVATLNGVGEPSLQLLARDKTGAVYGGRCGVHLGGGVSSSAGSGRLNQGAISPDGERIYFSTRSAPAEGVKCSTDPATNPLRIYKRTGTHTEPEIAPLIEGGPAAGNDLYQGASLDGSKVYLTTTRALVAADKDSGGKCDADLGPSAVGCDLYLYDAAKPPAERLTDVSAGGPGDPTPGEGAGVLSSIVAVSGDGSHAYFAAQGVLTDDLNPEGDGAIAGQPNLYLYQRDDAHPSGLTAFIGTLAAGDKEKLWGTEQSFIGGASAVPMLGKDEAGDEVGGDGHVLAFASKAPLTADDSDGGHADVFRYDAQSDTLERISKAAPGGSEVPASDVGVNSNGSAPISNPAQQGRWVSEDGQTIAFATAEPLAAEDGDGLVNPYLWADGQLGRLPSANQELQTENNPTVSLDGTEVAFSTTNALLPQDGDTASDVYLVRADGGFPNPAPPLLCDPLSEAACPGPPSSPPAIPPAATPSFTGPGNQRSTSCRKGLVRKHARCVKPKQKKSQAKKRAGHKRGGKK